ncbi:hypothetical protein HJC23_000633 [Cyclotella cryptica]|uniref:MYND-type domain-containing protein n=1 Tax=Cyclotella cryptica TaxID=29204 RepID=A0ABD3Q716_9STRA
MANEYFTPQWQRPRRKNDVVPATSPTSNPPFWHEYPCLMCRQGRNQTAGPSNNNAMKRCSRCKATIYCSSTCQKLDFGEGKHKAHCVALGKLWEEKSRLEHLLWYGSLDDKCNGGKSKNPFDDDYEHPETQQKQQHEYPIIGKFWYDQPQTPLQKRTTEYCVVMLQLIQLLGRAESWRVSRIMSGQRDTFNNSASGWGSAGVLNPLSLELAIDLSFTLLHLDRTDGRVRLLIPSLLLEGGYYQEAYDFIKHWTRVDGCLMILDLALPGGADTNEEEQDNSHSIIGLQNQDMLESPTLWMDGEMVYPSIGMVFELAFLKCHLLSLLKCEQQAVIDTDGQYSTEVDTHHCKTLMQRVASVGKDELMRQVNVLLSVVHKWNPHLLPNFGQESYDARFGASPNSSANLLVKNRDSNASNKPRTPPALDTLLNRHPPGFELQYAFGNPGGGSIDEAASIWQRDMILWHVINPTTMEHLSVFCKELEANLVDTSVLTGEVEENIPEYSGTGLDENPKSRAIKENNVAQRKEAEELVAKLKRENPDRTMDQIMMHPEMAALMIKHLHTE